VISEANRLAALRDPEYHRYLMFESVDRVIRRNRRPRDQAKGPPPSHRLHGLLRGPQPEIITRAEMAIREAKGEVIVIRMSRQTGKNELEAMMEVRALSIWRAIPGSCWVRTAPTYQPQIVNSKLRLDKHIQADPLIDKFRRREGYIYEVGECQVHFLSAGPTANVVGGTANICLSVDEAHKIDADKFDEDIAPFTASTNAPILMWGVGACKQDMLYRYRQDAEGTDRLMEYPAAIWCEQSEAYAGHYEARIRVLGSDHPIIKTQYDLIDIEAIGGYLAPGQRSSLFSGDHQRMEGPRNWCHYALLVDIGGEAETEVKDPLDLEDKGGRDATVALVIEWDLRESVVYPFQPCRIVQSRWWVGAEHDAAEGDLIEMAQHWGVEAGVIDARGVGEATAMAVHRRVPCIEAYKANAASVSEDCYDLLARISKGAVRYYRADPAEDKERREMEAQAIHTQYQIGGHDLMRLAKPTGDGASVKYIDGIKALTYLHRAVPAGALEGGGIMSGSSRVELPET